MKTKNKPHSNPVKVPYFDLARQHEALTGSAQDAFARVFRSGAYILGPELKVFETKFAEYIGALYAAGVGSGTDALIFSLLALGIKKGDEVIVPSFTFTSTALAVVHVGAKPVFADVCESSFNLDPESVLSAISSKTRAMIPVHLFGQCADMDALMAIAKKKKIKVVEDACQAHGALFGAKKAGAFGDLGCFSFYPTKNLGGTGDGGMVTTSNNKLLNKILQYRNLGKGLQNAMIHDEIGWTSRLDSLQAAFLNEKLKILDELNEQRRSLAKLYHQHLRSTPLVLPLEAPKTHHVYHLYVVRVPDGQRDALRSWLQVRGIPSMVHYEIPVHRQPIMKKYPVRKVTLPVTERLRKEVLTLPFFPGMTSDEVETVAQAIKGFFLQLS